MDEENFIKTLQVATPSGVVTLKVWSTPRKPKTTAGWLEKLVTLAEDTSMTTPLVLGEESSTPQQKKKGRLSGPTDPFSEGINVAGPSNPIIRTSQIEPPPIPTPALPLSSYTRGQVEEFPIDLDDIQDSVMEAPLEQEGTRNDFKHAPASTREPEDKENADDQEMLDEEEEKTPRALSKGCGRDNKF